MESVDLRHFKLKKILGRNVSIPEDFLEKQVYNTGNSLYLASCSDNQYLFISDSFQAITGHPPNILLHQGIDRWINLIHQDDVEATINGIIRKCIARSQETCTTHPSPFSLEYRLRHASGKWIWVRDTKCVLSTDRNDNIEKVLGSFEDITSEKKGRDLAFINSVEQHNPTGAILNAWRQVMQAKGRHSLDSQPIPDRSTASIDPIVGSSASPDEAPALTKREKEVLALLGQGLSTKQLADQLYISPHTVETHRRHLIEKFNARNSVELVMKASRTFLI